MGQDRLGPSYYFSLMVRTFLKVYMELVSYFLFLQEQIKDIIIIFFRSKLLVCVFITAGPITKLFTWGDGDSGGHVLRETTMGPVRNRVL